jgi:DNA-binding MarR family transcriptional regulator
MEKFGTFWQTVAALPAVEGGISPMEMAAMPPVVASLLRAISRSGGASLDGLAAELGFDLEQASRVSALLVERGYLLTSPSEQADAPPVYRVHLTRTRRHNLPLNF